MNHFVYVNSFFFSRCELPFEWVRRRLANATQSSSIHTSNHGCRPTNTYGYYHGGSFRRVPTRMYFSTGIWFATQENKQGFYIYKKHTYGWLAVRWRAYLPVFNNPEFWRVGKWVGCSWFWTRVKSLGGRRKRLQGQKLALLRVDCGFSQLRSLTPLPVPPPQASNT
jgi:hypothetical protein